MAGGCTYLILGMSTVYPLPIYVYIYNIYNIYNIYIYNIYIYIYNIYICTWIYRYTWPVISFDGERHAQGWDGRRKAASAFVPQSGKRARLERLGIWRVGFMFFYENTTEDDRSIIYIYIYVYVYMIYTYIIYIWIYVCIYIYMEKLVELGQSDLFRWWISNSIS